MTAENFTPPNHKQDYYKWIVLANVMIGTFIAVLDATIVNVGLPKIMAAFGTNLDKVEWVLTGYLLAFGVTLPTSGWLADTFGFKRIYMIALLLFTLGSFLCGLSWSVDVLIFFRIIQGIGAGLLMPVGMAIIMREFPPEQRGFALGFWTIAAAASVSLGPMIGGYLIDNIRWQSIFDVNVPIGIFGLIATSIIQRKYKTQDKKSLDIVGLITMGCFLTFFLLALAEGNASWNTGGWTSNFILSCFSISIVSLVIFLTWEFSTKNPIIDLKLLTIYNFGLSNIVLFFFGIGMFGSTFLLPLYLQNSLGYTALQAGMVFLPVGIIQAAVAPVAGYLSDKINPKIPIAAGISVLALSMFLNSNLSIYSEKSQILFPLCLRGFGMGILFASLGSVSLMDIPKPKIAQASGLFNVIRQIGGSFGVAFFGTLLMRRTIFHTAMLGESSNQYSAGFQKIYYNLQYFVQKTMGLPASESALRAKALLSSHLYQQAFVKAINDDFFIAGAITLLALPLVLILRTGKRKSIVKATPSE